MQQIKEIPSFVKNFDSFKLVFLLMFIQTLYYTESKHSTQINYNFQEKTGKIQTIKKR